jgi:hypothetical protein
VNVVTYRDHEWRTWHTSCSYIGTEEIETMTCLRAAALCVVGGLLAACSGAPSGDAPDYEFDLSGDPGAGSGAGSGSAGDDVNGGAASGDGDYDSTRPADSKDGEPEEGEPEPPAPLPTTATAKLGGTTLSVSEVKLWSEVSSAGEYNVFVYVTGPGVETGSDFIISARQVGSGCDNTKNFIAYRPKNDTQYMPRTTKDAGCGLQISELPTTVGGRLRGSFKGTLHAINVSTPRSREVDLTFDVLREK